jgi:hypothetical protein
MSWPNKRKFSYGPRVETLHEVIDAARRGKWLYVGSVPKHPSIVVNMSLTTVAGMIERKALRHTVRDPSFPYIFKATWMEAEQFANVPSVFWVSCSEIPATRNPYIEVAKKEDIEAACKSAVLFHRNQPDAAIRVEYTS